MPLTFSFDPVVTPELRDGLLDLWTDVTNAGGAVGFVPPSGTLTMQVAPGEYEVVVTRGPEYSAWPQSWPASGEPVDLRTANGTLNATLAHVVDTTGWVSADLHVHAVNSPDSSVPNEQRALAFLYVGPAHALLTINYRSELYLARRIEVGMTMLAEDASDETKSRILLEVQRSLDHFDRQFPALGLGQLLVGPEPAETGLSAYLAANMDAKVDGARLPDVLQFDPALSYGLVEYLRTLDMLKGLGWSPRRCVPHGGHQMSLNIAAGLGLGGNESYPDLFQPFGGFPDGVKVENSFITMPDLPGIGFEGKSNLISVMRELSD